MWVTDHRRMPRSVANRIQVTDAHRYIHPVSLPYVPGLAPNPSYRMVRLEGLAPGLGGTASGQTGGELGMGSQTLSEAASGLAAQEEDEEWR